MADGTPKRRSTDRGRLGRGVITLSTVTVIGIMFNIISGIGHQAQSAIELTKQQGQTLINIREDMQATRNSYAVMFAELSGKVDEMRAEITDTTDDRFRGKDWLIERQKLIELMEAHLHALEREIEQMDRRMAAHEISCPLANKK